MEIGDQVLMVEGKESALALQELITKARAGDDRSFEEIMVLHERRVFRTSFRILGNSQDAQDATQEVFLRLFKFLGRFDVKKEFNPWLYTITVNVCRDISRKRKPEELLPEHSQDFAASNPHNRSLGIQIIEEGLKSLTEKERAALVLRDLQGLSTQEVAQILGSSETTVRSHISRARIKLKEFRDQVSRRQS